MVLDCVFKGARRLLYILSAFVFSLIVLVYFFIPVERPWQLFLLALPRLQHPQKSASSPQAEVWQRLLKH